MNAASTAYGPKPLEPDETVFFLHIPKTAGTTLVQLILDHMDVSDVLAFYALQSMYYQHHNDGPEVDIGQRPIFHGRFFSAHLPFKAVSYMKKPRAVTMLREPISLLMSTFNYMKARADYGISAELSLGDFLQGRYGRQVLNPQVQWLADTFSQVEELFLRWRLLKGLEPDPEVESMEQILQRLGSDPKTLETALKRLAEDLDFFGIVERMPESYELLCYRFAWSPMSWRPRLNVTEYSYSEPTDEEMELMLRHTELDRRLYDAACKIFDERLAYSRSHESSRLRKRFLVSRGSLPPQESFATSFADPVFGENWYQREDDGGFAYYRWTGPGLVSTLYVSLVPRPDYYLIVVVMADMGQLRELEMAANGVPLSHDFVLLERSRYVFKAHIPYEAFERDPDCLKITLAVPETVRPSDIDPSSPDDRRLGILVDWVSISQAADDPFAAPRLELDWARVNRRTDEICLTETVERKETGS